MSSLVKPGFSQEQLRDRFVGITSVLLAHIDSLLPSGLKRVVAPEDVLQEAFIKALHYKDSFRPADAQDFIRLAKLLCEHVMISIIHKHSTIKRGRDQLAGFAPSGSASYVILYNQLHVEHRTPSRVVSSREAVAALQSALLALAQDRREAVHLRHIDGLSVNEIALRMKKTRRSINSLIYHGLKQLKDELENAESPEPSRVARWLERIRQALQLGSLGHETVQAAKELLRLFGM